MHNVTTEERINRSHCDIEKTYEAYKRGVNQIDINTGKIIRTFSSVSEAARFIECDSSNISKLCKKSGTGYGYRWQYSTEDYVKRDYSARQVCQFDLNTNEILNIFSSISEAAKFVDGDSSYISKVCRGVQKSSKGYGWKYI